PLSLASTPAERLGLSLHDALPISLAGVGEDGTYAAVYRNAAGTFTIWGRLEPLIFASFEWGNMDDDDDLELLQSGGRLDERILRSEEHTSELQSRDNLVCRLLLEK